LGELGGVSGRLVGSAITLKKASPYFFERVKSGSVNLIDALNATQVERAIQTTTTDVVIPSDDPDRLAKLKARLNAIEKPDDPVPPNQKNLKVMEEIDGMLRRVKTLLGSLSPVKSFEEYQQLGKLWAAVGDGTESGDSVQWKIGDIAKTTDNIIAHRAQKVANDFLEDPAKCKNRQEVFRVETREISWLFEGCNYDGEHGLEILRYLKTILAQHGYVCVGGHNFVKVDSE
jgi:hypothetical protein